MQHKCAEVRLHVCGCTKKSKDVLRFHFIFFDSFLHVLFFWMEMLPVRGQWERVLGNKGPDASPRRLGTEVS